MSTNVPQPRPVDPDVDLRVPAEHRELSPSALPVLTVIALGGMVGAAARYGLSTAWPHTSGGFPWSIFVINVSGCLLLGVLMVIVTQVITDRPLLRPFLGTGVIGGYTTFSTYVLDIHHAAAAGHPQTALLYLAATLVAGLIAVWTGMALARRLAPDRPDRPPAHTSSTDEGQVR